MYIRLVLVGRPCERCLLLQQFPTCFIRLICMVLAMEGRWLYSYCFVGCCFQDLFTIAKVILEEQYFPSNSHDFNKSARFFLSMK